jgi:hypothetical protein
MATELISPILQLILALLPALMRSEVDKLASEINRREKEWEDEQQKILEEIDRAGSISELNLIISKLLRRVQG